MRGQKICGYADSAVCGVYMRGQSICGMRGQVLQSHNELNGRAQYHHAAAAVHLMLRRCRPCGESRSGGGDALSGRRWLAPLPRRQAPVVGNQQVGVAWQFRSGS